MKRIAHAFHLFALTLLLASCNFGIKTVPTATPYPPTDTKPPTSTSLPPTPTPTKTPIPPTPTITPSPTPTYIPENALLGAPTPVPGWKTYLNDFLGYSVNLPSEAKISVRGADSMDMNEAIPPGFTFDEYFDYVMDILPENLCVSIDFPGVYITIVPPYSISDYVVPCPGMGIGDQYTIEPAEETLTIGGRHYTDSHGGKLYLKSTGAFYGEYYFFGLENGFRLVYNGGPHDDMSLDTYQAQRLVAKEIIATLHWYDAPDLVKPGTTCAGKFTHLIPSVYAVVTGKPEDPPNRVRSGPTTSAEIITQIYPQTIVKVLEGPVCADGLVFWRVANSMIPGGSGWTAEGNGTAYWLERLGP